MTSETVICKNFAWNLWCDIIRVVAFFHPFFNVWRV